MAIPDKAITRNEQYLSAMAGQSGRLPDAPITRKERYLAKAAGQDVETPEPITREEMYLDVIAEGGGGGGEAVLINKTVTANGTYLPAADSADGYNKVVVNVPTPTPALTPKTITENGIYLPQDDGADGYDTVTVNVAGSGDSVEYTPINILTVLNDSTHAYNNRFVIANHSISEVKRIVATVKYEDSGNCIWFCSIVRSNSLQNAAYVYNVRAPFANRITGSSCNVARGAADADGFWEHTITVDYNDTHKLVFGGAWGDSTYSHSVSFKSVVGYDANNGVLFDLIPCVLKSGQAVMLDRVTGKFLVANLYEENVTIAGEVV